MLSSQNISTRLLVPFCLFASIFLVSVFSDAIGQGGRNQDNDDKKGLVFRLSDGEQGPESKPQQQIAETPTKPLTEAAIQTLLKRLRPIRSERSDERGFALRDRSLPPPRTGQTIINPFPSSDRDTAPDQVSSGPLEVLRFAPEGEVPIAPHLSITFSQPMVPVTSNSDLAAHDVPVNLSPQPNGRWRWLGTKTLLFEPEGRFPMATDYMVEIPAGTKSTSGGTLASTKRWTFSTPLLEVKSRYPYDDDDEQPRDPLIFIEFDQRIDPVAALKFITLSSKDREWPLRLATAEEIKANDDVKALSSNAVKDHWMAFRVGKDPGEKSDQLLPADTSFIVSVEAGAPSAEGPRKTVEEQNFEFDTYGPLHVIYGLCEYPNKKEDCSPLSPWSLHFSNRLSSDFDPGKITIEPKLEGQSVSHDREDTLTIKGYPNPRTNYRITLDASIKDVFGQTLGENATLNFGIGSMPLRLSVPGNGFVVLDPAAKKRISIYSVNHERLKVALYAVVPEDYGKLMAAIQHRRIDVPFPEIGRRIFSETIKIDAKPDEFVETPIDLQPALNEGLGHALLLVGSEVYVPEYYGKPFIATWIQSTGIGLDVFSDKRELLTWATSLKDGKPLAGVQLELRDLTPAATLVSRSDRETATSGLAKIEAGFSQSYRFLVARKGNDAALLIEYPSRYYGHYGAFGWNKQYAGDFLRWHVFDDRGVYRPGEEVHIKGWIRRINLTPSGDVMLPGGAARNVTYSIEDSLENEIAEGTLNVNALGGFHFSFKVPANADSGYAKVDFKAESEDGHIYGRDYIHRFQIQEFRRPEFEVKVTASEGPHFAGSGAELTVAANYYTGGALPGAEVDWSVVSRPSYFTPPNRGDFIFGKWIPWWDWDASAHERGNRKAFKGRTDESGKHRLQIDFDAINPPRPAVINASANLQDVNRQVISSSRDFIVHPAELYVGLRSPRTFVQKGDPLIVESIVTDLDGKTIAGREVRMRAMLIHWVFEKGKWNERETDPQECVVRSAADPVKCRFETKAGGQYRIIAAIIDDKERRNESELRLWVAGEGAVPSGRNLAREELELIPNRKEYQGGETAEILVQSPFGPAEGIVTLRRSGLLMSERFTMDSTTHTLRIPIKDDYVPNIHVQVDLVGTAIRTDGEGRPLEQLPRRPASASGSIKLSIPPLKRKLTVRAIPRDNVLEPGGTTFVNVEVRDAAGKPVKGSELALIVVDEAVLALTNYDLADPLGSFYQERGNDVGNRDSRSDVLLADPDELISQIRDMQQKQVNELPLQGRVFSRESLYAASQGGIMESVTVTGTDAARKVRSRIDFNSLAIFAPSVSTDINGRAKIKVKLPDNLTRYRVMVVAVAGEKQFGSAESSITARLPLMVRPSPPRFLNFGDRFELPVVVQNQTETPIHVDLAVRAANAQLTGVKGRRITVPANDRVEVRFPAAAAKPGTARFQIVGASGKWSDAAEISMPVWTPATTEAFATYGEVDAGALIQPVKAPSDAIKEFGGLEVTTSSTQLQSLTDAVIYLTTYPFECAEQIASRVLAIAALRDVLAAFDANGLPKADELIASVNRDIERLRGLQNEDGGFGFWRRGGESWPYLSIHVAHALQRASAKGFDVPESMLESSQIYLDDIEGNIPDWCGVEVKRLLIAYALYVRRLMDDRDAKEARAQIAKAGGIENMPLDALGFLLPVLSGDPASQAEVAAIRRHFGNRVEETAAAAHFTTTYKDGAHLLLHSDRRADAIILEALIGDDPKNELIPKIVRGLLAHRKQGRWTNTQENAFVLLALDRYFAVYEKATPDFVARAWLGEAYAGGHEFRGRTTERHQIEVPMSYLMGQGGAQNLVLSKEGAGRMYYRIGMNYAPESLQLKPADYGFTVTRVYEAIENANDVRREEDGTWRIKAGAQVRVRLTMVAQARRYHVALVDPLPAGLEAQNPALATTGPIPQDPKEQGVGSWWWWRRPWYEHQNMRDERVEAFASILWEGVHNYTYVARATTPGVFVVPPAKAEEMYHPETYGRGGTDRVVIE
jgi:alpha-2-macroglobulin